MKFTEREEAEVHTRKCVASVACVLARAVALVTEVTAREGSGTRMRAIAGSADAVPAPDASFDAVLLLDVTQQLRNPVRAPRETSRLSLIHIPEPTSPH